MLEYVLCEVGGIAWLALAVIELLSPLPSETFGYWLRLLAVAFGVPLVLAFVLPPFRRRRRQP